MPQGFERIYFRDIQALSWEEAYWHACCNQPWVPIAINRELVWSQYPSNTVYFLNPRNFRPIGAINGLEV